MCQKRTGEACIEAQQEKAPPVTMASYTVNEIPAAPLLKAAETGPNIWVPAFLWKRLWPRPGHCGHPRSKPSEGRSLSPSLSV